MYNIIDELLDFTRATEPEAESVEFDSWLNELIQDQEIPKDISVNFSGGLEGAIVEIDPGRMQRAIINIISNSCEAMQDEKNPEKYKPGSRIDISTSADEHGIHVRVSDNGLGIADDVLPHIFEPLYSTKTFGVGLGMPTIRQIVQMHDGELSVDSKVGKGTTINVYLPVAT